MELIFYQFFLYMISCVCCYNIDENNYLMFNGKTGSYFGYSSGLLTNEHGTWLLVGAPKDNFTDMPNVISPGNIYKCPVNVTRVYQSECEEMVNLRTGGMMFYFWFFLAACPLMTESRRNDRFSYEESNQLLGANLLVNDYRIVACSSLWKYIYYEHSEGYVFGIGYCFTINKDLITVQKKRFTDFETGTQLVTVSGFPRGMAQIGFAVSGVAQNPDWDFLLGAPGMNDGMGGFVFLNTNKIGSGSYKNFSIKDESNLRNTSRGTNVGYSIGSGKFGPPSSSSFPLIVIGSPRFSNQHEGHIGAVFMLQDSPTLVSKKLITGDQSGSGFGTSICVADINGDGKDDLFVGAPYYTHDIGRENIVECGKVHIYYGTGDSNYTTKYGDIKRSSLFGLRKTRGRFGLTIANIGDINADSFTDIAIGAPYEDDMNGAVYIYNGRRGYISNMYSQRISGKKFDPMLKGFGMQISASLDVDNNQYPDFAVGAYMSDRAVILRTRPIVNMTVSLSVTPDVIPLNSSGLGCALAENEPCVTIKLCFRFQGIGVDEGILIDFDIRSDTIRTQNRKSSRLQLSIGEMKYRGDVEVTKFRVVKGRDTCATIIGRVQAITKEFFSAIADELRFEAEFRLSNESMPGRVFPILNKLFSRKINKSAYFEKECSGKCRSNLVLEIENPANLEIVINQTEQINIRVRVRNTDQPSYATTIYIQSSNNTAFLGSQENQGSRTVSCKMAGNNTMYQNAVQCEIDKPLYRHHFVDFQARFNVSMGELLPCERCYDGLLPYVTFMAVAETQGSIEVDPSNNRKMLNVPIKFDTKLDINGISIPEQHKLSKDDDDYIEFVHEYTIYNNGPSPLPFTNFILDVPVQTPDKVKLMEKSNIDIIAESPTSKCRLISYISDLREPSSTFATEPTTSGSTSTTSQQTSTLQPQQTVEPNKRKKREAQPPEQFTKQIITNITCGSFGCAKYGCTLDHLDVEEKTSFKVRTSVKKNSLPFGKNDVALRYKTRGEIQQPSHRLFYPWSRGVWYEAYIDFFPEKFSPQTTKINIWIIIGGCLGGLLLIIILAVILWKCGFFKRKEKTKGFKEWKRQSTIRSRSQRSGSSKSSRSTKWEPQEVAQFTKSSKSKKLNGK